MWIDISCFPISDSTRRRRRDSLLAGEPSPHAVSVDVATAICSDSYRQSPLSKKIHRGQINLPILLSVWCSSLDVLHFAERNRKVRYCYVLHTCYITYYIIMCTTCTHIHTHSWLQTIQRESSATNLVYGEMLLSFASSLPTATRLPDTDTR